MLCGSRDFFSFPDPFASKYPSEWFLPQLTVVFGHPLSQNSPLRLRPEQRWGRRRGRHLRGEVGLGGLGAGIKLVLQHRPISRGFPLWEITRGTVP